MIPLIKRVVHAFLFDELAAKRWLRGATLAISAGGVGFADQLGALLGGSPRVVLMIKAVSIFCGFVAGAITAGEKNKPEPAPVEPPAQP